MIDQPAPSETPQLSPRDEAIMKAFFTLAEAVSANFKEEGDLGTHMAVLMFRVTPEGQMGESRAISSFPVSGAALMEVAERMATHAQHRMLQESAGEGPGGPKLVLPPGAMPQ